MSDWTVFLSGEIHTDWRERLVSAAQGLDLPVTFTGPVTDHSASDDCGLEPSGLAPVGENRLGGKIHTRFGLWGGSHGAVFGMR